MGLTEYISTTRTETPFSVSRKKLDPKYEGYIHLGGMVLLLGLMALVMYNDIAKLITG